MTVAPRLRAPMTIAMVVLSGTGAVRLSDQPNDLVTTIGQRQKRGTGELACAHQQQLQSHLILRARRVPGS